ncbi:hypothetical protein NYE24_00455 [Paenibacillus sp. FSL H7-0350]|uniref:hypothetical protein n=1 Tax=Paenibacillus sp. FSL H7-0350 TaxID=2975345 RepID=UPI0031593EB2
MLNNLQSYLLRNELGMSNVAPLVLILIFIMFFTAVVRMPLVLSIIATISGYAMFAVIQTIIVLLVFGSISNITGVAEGYFLQLMTAVVVFAAFSYIYRKGKGFTFDLDKLRFKLEDILLSVLIFGFVIGVSVLLYYNDILLNVLIFLVMSAFLLYYSTRKEREDA